MVAPNLISCSYILSETLSNSRKELKEPARTKYFRKITPEQEDINKLQEMNSHGRLDSEKA